MDKKVGMRGRGGGKFPLRLRGLALLLSFLVVLLTPFSAFGYGTVDGTGEVTVVGVKKDGSSFYQQFNVFGEDEQVRYNDSNNLQSNLEALSITARYTAGIQKGDILGIDFVIPLGRYKGFDFNIDCFTLTEKNTRSKTIFKYSGTINGNTDESDGDISYYYSYSATASSSNTFHFEDACSFSYTGRVVYTVTLTNFVYSTQGLNLTFYLDDFTASIESPESGQSKKLLSGLSSIIEFVKNIFTKITELPQAIGNFINSLGDKISGFFSNLISNLRGWFDNVGQWFTNLGNNIKQWFIDITNNIKGFFSSLGDRISGFFETIWNNTVEFFTSLFKPSDDYFDNLQKDLDAHMSKHLGAVYNVPKELIAHLNAIVNGLKGSNANHLYIAIPEFSFRLKGEKKVLLEAQQFDLLSSINAIEEGGFKTAYNAALIIMHGMIDLALAIGCFRMIYRKIINKVGIEGGDEL